MADKFIDQDETQFYGLHASKHIRQRLLGKLAAFDSTLVYIADQIDTSTAAVKSAVDAARAKDAEQRQGTKTKTPLLHDARRLLGRFSKHLAAHENIDTKVFFTHNGTAAGVGHSAQDVLLAITHIASKLSTSNAGIRDRAHWYSQFDAMMKSLAPAVAFANDARADRQSLTPEVEAARQAWINTYISAKCIVEGLLRQLGRLEQMSVFFYDLRVSPGMKVTQMPPDEPEVADESDKDDQDGA